MAIRAIPTLLFPVPVTEPVDRVHEKREPAGQKRPPEQESEREESESAPPDAAPEAEEHQVDLLARMVEDEPEDSGRNVDREA